MKLARPVIVLAATVLLAVPVYSAPALDFKEPLASSSLTFFGSFSPGDGTLNDVDFVIDYSGANEAGNGSILVKNASDTKFSNSLFLKSEVRPAWDNNAVSFGNNHPDTFLLGQDESLTSTCDGREQTVEWDGGFSSTTEPLEVNYTYGTLRRLRNEGEFDDINCNGDSSDTDGNAGDFLRVKNAVDVSGTSSDTAEFRYMTSPDLGSGYYEYRAYWKQKDGGDLYGDIIAFSIGKSGNNLPRPDWTYGFTVEDDGTSINPGNTLTNVTPNSTIKFKINDPDGDSLDSLRVYSPTTIETVFNEQDSGWTGAGSDGDKIEVNTQDNRFLSKENTSYSLYVEMTDNSDTSTTRKSLLTTFDTGTGDNTDFVNATSIGCHTLNLNKECQKFGYNSSTSGSDEVYEMWSDVTVQDASIRSVKFWIADEYDYPHDYIVAGKNYTSESNGRFYLNLSSSEEFHFNDSGEWNASVRVETTTGVVDWKNDTWNLSFGTPVVENLTVNGASSGPVDVKKYRPMNVSADITCSGGECASETNGTHPVAGNMTVWLDPASAETEPRKVSVSDLSPSRRKVVTEIYRNDDTVLKQFARWLDQWI